MAQKAKMESPSSLEERSRTDQSAATFQTPNAAVGSDETQRQIKYLPSELNRMVNSYRLRGVNSLSSAETVWVGLTEEERQRLGGGGDEGWMKAYKNHRGAIGMWMHLRRVSKSVAILQLAREAGIIATDDRLNALLCKLAPHDSTAAALNAHSGKPPLSLIAPSVDSEQIIEKKTSSHRLVLVRRSRHLNGYWVPPDGNEAERIIDQGAMGLRKWKYLSAVVVCAKQKDTLTDNALVAVGEKFSLKDAKSDLSKILPKEFLSLLQSKAGEHFLDRQKLPPEQICVLDIDTRDEVFEIERLMDWF